MGKCENAKQSSVDIYWYIFYELLREKDVRASVVTIDLINNIIIHSLTWALNTAVSMLASYRVYH